VVVYAIHQISVEDLVLSHQDLAKVMKENAVLTPRGDASVWELVKNFHSIYFWAAYPPGYTALNKLYANQCNFGCHFSYFEYRIIYWLRFTLNKV